MSLAKYLKEKKVVTGPLDKNTSHSGLDIIRKYLLGLPQFKGGDEFLKFGAALHEVFLENKFETYNVLPKKDKETVLAMTNKLNCHPVVKSLMENSTREEKIYGNLFYAYLALILDAKQPHLKRGFDLKTTSCKTQDRFEEKMVEYGYVKQGLIYKKITGIKEFYFVAINKEAPHSIFIIDSNKFKTDEKYAEQELKFLTYFYKHYGKIVDHSQPHIPVPRSNGEELMRDILAEINIRTQADLEIRDREKLIKDTNKKIITLLGKFSATDKKLFKRKIDLILKSI